MATFFTKKRKDVTMRVYKTNQEAHKVFEPEVAKKVPEAVPSSDQEGMWEKCPTCASILYTEDLNANERVCMKCGYHFRLGAKERVLRTADAGSFVEFNADLQGTDPLEFPEYDAKIEKARGASDIPEGIVTGTCTIGGEKCVLAVMDSRFMMGSMGAVVGEKFALAAEKALEEKIPLVVFTASGGARMQEGLVSLLQMGKTAAVLGKLDEAAVPYIVVLTDPTTGGVTASFAMLGDVTIAEPNALIGFAGRRVIEQTVKQTLPPGFQRAEFLLDKGFVDMIVDRRELKDTLSKILALHAQRRSA